MHGVRPFDPLDHSLDASSGDATSDDGLQPNFCTTVSPAPAFCADFDTSLDPAAGFTSAPIPMNGGMIGLSTVAKSGQHSLLSSFGSPPQPSMYTNAYLQFSNTGMVSTIELDYEVMFPMRPTMGHLESQNITVLTPSNGTFYYDLDLYPTGPDQFLQERNFGTFMAMPVNIPVVSAGVWHHVRLTLDLNASTHTFEIDGATVSSGLTNFPLTPGMANLDVGINYEINSATGNQIYVDNVVLYWQ